MEQMEYPVIDVKRTGKKLKQICEEQNISAKDLQKLLHLGTVQAVYHWFSGSRLPNLDNFFAISKLLKVSLDELLIGQKEQEFENLNLEFELVRHNDRLLVYWEKLSAGKKC